MAIYLDEMQFGKANDLIGFPHLLVCIGVLALTNNCMYGLHIDQTATNEVDGAVAALHTFMQADNAAPILALYGCANWTERYKNVPNEQQAWETEMGRIAGGLGGWHGLVRGFNMAIISPRDGTYVEYHPDYPAWQCQIYYKRNEKMNYPNKFAHTPTTGYNADIAKYNYRSGRTIPVISETVGAAVQPTYWNKGDLHEVNYATRLFSFNC